MSSVTRQIQRAAQRRHRPPVMANATQPSWWQQTVQTGRWRQQGQRAQTPRQAFDQNTLPPSLRGWYHPHDAATYVARALMATAERRDWKPRKKIHRRKVKRVLHQLERWFMTGKKHHLEQATRWWDCISKETKQRIFVQAVGDLLSVARLRREGRIPFEVGSAAWWERLEAALTQAELPPKLLSNIEAHVRLIDYVGTKAAKKLSDSVRLACAAACDIGRYDVARDIAQRTLKEVE